MAVHARLGLLTRTGEHGIKGWGHAGRDSDQAVSTKSGVDRTNEIKVHRAPVWV